MIKRTIQLSLLALTLSIGIAFIVYQNKSIIEPTIQEEPILGATGEYDFMTYVWQSGLGYFNTGVSQWLFGGTATTTPLATLEIQGGLWSDISTSTKKYATTYCINNSSPDCITAWPSGGGSFATTTNDYWWNNTAGLTMSSQITAGTGLSWTSNTLNAEVQTSDLHSAVTLAGTPNYLTLLGQQITQTVLDINDDTDLTATTPLSLSALGAMSIDTSGTWTGNAGTATALAANGANCSAGSYLLGVNASGTAESCTDATTEIDSAIATHTAIANAHHTLVSITGEDDTAPVTNADTNFNITLSAAPTGGKAGVVSLSINGSSLSEAEFISVTGVTMVLNVPYAVDASDIITTRYF